MSRRVEPRSEHRPARHQRRAAQLGQRDQVVNLEHAIRELGQVREELAALPDGLTKHEREKHLLEPMSRVSLVVRFLEEILERNGWTRGVPA